MRRKPLTDKDGEVRELTGADIRKMRPAAEVHGQAFVDAWRRGKKNKRPDPELVDDENPEWTDEDFRKARPAAEVMGKEFMDVRRKRRSGERGPQKAPTKRQVSIRLDSEVLEHFKRSGPGWQTRINAVLKRSIKRAPR
jgi:uncharacterized protein (DUF4415 family)